tara:strand:+ start:4495 stop:4728 length:234 start_codon:yes stop_codon:yes gene_type:complete
MDKTLKTPIYVRKAQKAYITRNKDNEEFILRKKEISKNWYDRNKEKVKAKYLENKEKKRIIDLENKEIEKEIEEGIN